MKKSKAARLPWPRKRLAEVLDIENTAIVPQAGTIYRYVGLEHIEQQTGRILDAPETDGAAIQSQKYLFNHTHVLYGKLRPNLNKVALPNFSGVCSTDILPLSVGATAIREYVAYYLRSAEFVHHAVKHATGTKMPRLGPRQFLQSRMPTPPLPVQERIVQILQKADGIRRKRQEARQQVDDVLRHLFVEMFGDPVSNPKSWRTCRLGDVLELMRNGTTARQNNLGRGYPVTRIETISHEVINPAKVRHVELDESGFSKWRLSEGDILFSHINSIGHIGKTAIYAGEPPNLTHGMNLLLLRADKSECLPGYLHAFLRMLSVRRKLRGMARQAVNQASLNQTQLRSVPIPVPPLKLQNKLLMAINQIQAAMQDLALALEDSELLLSNLISRAFSGVLTSQWETANAEWITAQAELQKRLPRLLVLALIRERAPRPDRKAAQAGVLVTALMKYAFLFHMEGNARRRFYRFVPYHYGPFAKELYADLERLQTDGLVTVENDTDEAKTRINLADPAKAEQALAELPDDLKEDVGTILDTYGDLDHKALLKIVYHKYPPYAKKSRLTKRTRKRAD